MTETEGITWDWLPDEDWTDDGTEPKSLRRSAVVTQVVNDVGCWKFGVGIVVVIEHCLECQAALDNTELPGCFNECGEYVYESCNCPNDDGFWLGHPMGRTVEEVIEGLFGDDNWNRALLTIMQHPEVANALEVTYV